MNTLVRTMWHSLNASTLSLFTTVVRIIAGDLNELYHHFNLFQSLISIPKFSAPNGNPDFNSTSPQEPPALL